MNSKKRNISGRFILKLPFESVNNEFANSSFIANSYNFQSQLAFRDLYKEFMSEFFIVISYVFDFKFL